MGAIKNPSNLPNQEVMLWQKGVTQRLGIDVRTTNVALASGGLGPVESWVSVWSQLAVDLDTYVHRSTFSSIGP